MKLFPPLKSILPVFAVIVFMTYSWSMAVTLWKLPSWLLYMTLGEIAVAFAYIFVVDLVECLVFLIGLLGLSAILPARFLRHYFAASGTALVLILSGSAMLHLGLHANADLREGFIRSLLPWWGVTLALTALIVWLVPRFRALEKFLLSLADRMLVFLYLTMPLTAMAAVLVLVRNIIAA